MYIPKKYGQSRKDLCPFCKKDATTKNKQQIPVCYAHKSSILQGLTCICGDHLELRNGKFGVYFNCSNCGNINLKKALEVNSDLGNKSKKVGGHKLEREERKKEKKEITITSDEVDLYYS